VSPFKNLIDNGSDFRMHRLPCCLRARCIHF